jgi:hypothetical protein
MRDRLPAKPYRYGLLAVAIAQLGVSLQVLLAPRSFYDDFPFGRSWVDTHPSYNEHLLYDYGAFSLGALVGLAIAAIWLDRRVVQLAIVNWLVASSIHFTWHAIHAEDLGTGDAIANLVGLFLYIAIPGWLLVKSRERSDYAPAEDPGRA